MKLVICGSSTFKEKMLEYRDKLAVLGHEGIVHPDYEAFVRGEKQDIWQRVEHEHAQVKQEQGYIHWYYQQIVMADGILVLNFDKNDITYYIGGNTLMEMGFAYVHHKKIFLLNPAPQMQYTDEILAMYTAVLNDDLSQIR